MFRLIPRAISALQLLAKEKHKLYLNRKKKKNYRTFCFSVEQLEVIFQSKRLLNVRSVSRSFSTLFAVLSYPISCVMNLLLTSLARDRTEGISALGPYCQDLGPIFSQNGPRAWFMYWIGQVQSLIKFSYVQKQGHPKKLVLAPVCNAWCETFYALLNWSDGNYSLNILLAFQYMGKASPLQSFISSSFRRANRTALQASRALFIFWHLKLMFINVEILSCTIF